MSQNKIFTSIILLMVYGITGCTTVYQAPKEGKIASMIFRNRSAKPLAVHFYKDSKQCTNREVFIPLLQSGEIRPTSIVADREVTFTISQDVRLYASGYQSRTLIYCLLTATFTPGAAKNYSFEYIQKDQSCGYKLIDSDTGKSVTYQQRTWIRALSNSGPFCTAR